MPNRQENRQVFGTSVKAYISKRYKESVLLNRDNDDYKSLDQRTV